VVEAPVPPHHLSLQSLLFPVDEMALVARLVRVLNLAVAVGLAVQPPAGVDQVLVGDERALAGCLSVHEVA
jgi:hypothetical protein